jgi:DNA-binding MarR family transcriptional regulator
MSIRLLPFEDASLTRQATTEAQISILLGMIAQLQITRGAKLLAPLGLNRSKLAVMQYLADNRDGTIGEMSTQLEINQPGITKIVQQFLVEGLVATSETDVDKRVKPLTITKKGLKKYQQTLAALQPDIAPPYQDWPKQELQVFLNCLEKLYRWMDENR